MYTPYWDLAIRNPLIDGVIPPLQQIIGVTHSHETYWRTMDYRIAYLQADIISVLSFRFVTGPAPVMRRYG
jgi:hypothetical protein